MERGLAIREMARTEGWSILSRELKDLELYHAHEISNLKGDTNHIGQEYLKHKQAIDTIQRILNSVLSELKE